MEWNSGILNDAFGTLLTQNALAQISDRYFVGSDASRNYGYDNARRLSQVQEWSSDPTNCTWDPHKGNLCTDFSLLSTTTYTYDKAGNRTDSGAAVGTGNRLTSFAGYTLAWDDAGFLTSKTGNWLNQTFWWNAAGQLDSVSTNGVKTRYGYDGWGRRISVNQNGVVTQWVHDGEDVLFELSGSGTLQAEYTYYPGTDHLHSVRRGGSMYYYAQDHQGTVLGLLSASGTVVNKYRYGAWGGPEGTVTEGVANPLRYTGREWDAGPELLYLRARYYDPDIARFVSEDPIGLAGGINPFAYAANDPINLTDRNGLNPDCEDGSGDDPDTPIHELPEICVEIRKDEGGSGGGWQSLLNFLEFELRGLQAGANPWRSGRYSDEGWFGAWIGRLIYAVRPVGVAARGSAAGLSSADDIFLNPAVLAGKTPDDIAGIVANAVEAGWNVGTLTRGSQAGSGFKLYDGGNRLIQWHPGGGHHGPAPYWKVSSAQGGIVRVTSQGVVISGD